MTVITAIIFFKAHSNSSLDSGLILNAQRMMFTASGHYFFEAFRVYVISEIGQGVFTREVCTETLIDALLKYENLNSKNE